MDRAAYHRSIFLDRRISPASDVASKAPVAPLVAELGSRAFPSPAYLFHIAHCGSTLLARALDDPAGPLVLREPMALRQLGVAAANGGADPGAVRLAAALYGRRSGAGTTLVKANVPVNWLIPDLLTLAPETPAILLYYPLETYLTAILRSGNHRGWVRFVTGELRPGVEAMAGPIAGLADAELAATLWLAQMRLYADVLARFPKTASLDADTLFDDPAAVLTAANRLLGRVDDPAAVAATVAGPIFSTYSKNPSVAFDNAARLAMRAATQQEVAAELAAAQRFLAQRLPSFPVPERLARPLAGQAPSLLG
jgi:hypothetical protein